MMNENTMTVKNEQTASERFTNMVLREFGANAGQQIEATPRQKRLVQGYFIVIDKALKTAEEERVRKNENNKNHDFDNTLPMEWKNVNLPDLALDVVTYARMGLDMMQDNMLFPIPYKNNKDPKNPKYNIVLTKGYNGKRYLAKKYALVPPINETIEIVYSTDTFEVLKKDREHNTEGYKFTVNNPFDRGEIVGGFIYLEYDNPVQNRLICMSMKEIEKRKPKKTSVNFWGGKAKEWVDGKQVEVESEGWREQMIYKTLIREAYSTRNIPIDPDKVDDSYREMRSRDVVYADYEVQEEITENANKISLEIPEAKDTLPISEASTPEENIASGAEF